MISYIAHIPIQLTFILIYIFFLICNTENFLKQPKKKCLFVNVYMKCLYVLIIDKFKKNKSSKGIRQNFE